MELTHVRPGTPCGEYLRKTWQPLCLSAELADLPKAVRLLGEDLVAFRDKSGRVGLLHRHCSHRGTSLEFGIPSQKGIRCCYHGWLYDIDGTVLETPGEPPDSPLKNSLRHGAYPTREFKGLVFAYMGAPGQCPDFPIYDTFRLPGDDLVPYSCAYPCNWLQVHENMMDPVHSTFLHTLGADQHLTGAYAVVPEMEFLETPDKSGVLYITTRRLSDVIWVRNNQVVHPNLCQVAGTFQDFSIEKIFTRISITRWTVPNDDVHCTILGWRHFNDVVDPNHIGRRAACGPGSVDFYGQTGDRDYQEMQRNPGDWEVMVSQGSIAVHAREHLGATDAGVALLRRSLRDAIRTRAEAEARHMYAQDTAYRIPEQPGVDERKLWRRIGRAVTEALFDADHLEGEERRSAIEARLPELRDRFA